MVSRRALHELIDPVATSAEAARFRVYYRIVAAIGVGAMVAGTVSRIEAVAADALNVLLLVVQAFFIVEYAARLWVAPEASTDTAHPWSKRSRWMLSPGGIVDLAAVLPFVIVNGLGASPDFVHLFGALWIFKLGRYSPGLRIIARTARMARDSLLSVAVGFLVIFFLAGTLMHFLERDAQPEFFDSIPNALWWTIVTLTTTGYGDVVPKTPGGRVLAGLVMVCGIGVFALWTGILATAFADEMRRRQLLRTWELVAKVPFFRTAATTLIADVVRLLKPREVNAGAVITRRGERGDCMYFIVSGTVEIELEAGARRLGAGDFFGEIALITGGPRVSTAVALRPCTLLSLDVTDFRDITARHPDLAKTIGEEATRRLIELRGNAPATA